MADDVRYSIEGLRELIKRLKTVEDGLDQLKEVHRQTAATVLRAAIPMTPRRSGLLAGTGRVGATNRAAIVRFGYTVSVPYANPIHFGWHSPSFGHLRRAHNIPENPWVTRAAQRSQPEWYDHYRNEVERLWDL